MGRAQKLKQQRRLERIEASKKEKKSSRFFDYVLGLVLIVILGFASVWIYSIFASREEASKSEDTSAYNTEERSYNKMPEMQIDTNKKYFAQIKTSIGEFKIEFFTKDAPKTVNNFVVLSRDKFYNGLTFHRIIKDFMIQGGDPKGDGTGGPGYQFEDEINDHKLTSGTVAMANSGPNTNGSQFFIITTEATPWLDGKHTPFGQVVKGMDVVMNISEIPTGENDKPLSKVKIEEITIEEI